MNWQEFRLTTRLGLKPAIVESVYSMIAEIDSVKTSWKLTGKLLPQTIERLTHSVIVTSTGASNRIEGNRLNDTEVEALYKLKKYRTLKKNYYDQDSERDEHLNNFLQKQINGHTREKTE